MCIISRNSEHLWRSEIYELRGKLLTQYRNRNANKSTINRNMYIKYKMNKYILSNINKYTIII